MDYSVRDLWVSSRRCTDCGNRTSERLPLLAQQGQGGASIGADYPTSVRSRVGGGFSQSSSETAVYSGIGRLW